MCLSHRLQDHRCWPKTRFGIPSSANLLYFEQPRKWVPLGKRTKIPGFQQAYDILLDSRRWLELVHRENRKGRCTQDACGTERLSHGEGMPGNPRVLAYLDFVAQYSLPAEQTNPVDRHVPLQAKRLASFDSPGVGPMVGPGVSATVGAGVTASMRKGRYGSMSQASISIFDSATKMRQRRLK